MSYRYYAAVDLNDQPVGFALLTVAEKSRFDSRQCSFGRSIRARELRMSDFAQPFPPYRVWRRIVLSPSALDSYHAGSIGWWHVTAEAAHAIAFGCTPATVYNVQGAVEAHV